MALYCYNHLTAVKPSRRYGMALPDAIVPPDGSAHIIIRLISAGLHPPGQPLHRLHALLLI